MEFPTSQYGHYHKYQTLHFDEALQIALSESLDIHNSTKEEQDLALAIQMSLVNKEPDQQKELCCSNGDTCSDPGPVQWSPDGTNHCVDQVQIAEEKTLVQDSEMKTHFEFSLTIDEDSSDDEEAERPGKMDNDHLASAEIDIWKEFHEMSVTSSQGTFPHDTPIHQPGPLMESDTLDKTTLSVVVPGKTPASTDANAETTSKSRDNSRKTPVSLADPDHDSGQSIWNYTLYDDMVKIPELGTFKRKKHFNGLVTVHLIEKMLSQTSDEPEKLWNTISLSPNDTRRRVLETHHTNIPTVPAQVHPDYPDKIESKPPSQDPCLQTEEERRSRLYNSLVRAQRRYAEKLAIPTGKDFRFTKQEWESLGEELPIEDWEAGFLEDHGHMDLRRKENSLWKGKEKFVEESDEEEEVLLMMAL